MKKLIFKINFLASKPAERGRDSKENYQQRRYGWGNRGTCPTIFSKVPILS